MKKSADTETENKTPGYTRRAVERYQKSHDRLQLSLDQGEKERLASVGITPAEIKKLIRAEYQKRVATDQRNRSASAPTDDELPEWFNY